MLSLLVLVYTLRISSTDLTEQVRDKSPCTGNYKMDSDQQKPFYCFLNFPGEIKSLHWGELKKKKIFVSNLYFCCWYLLRTRTVKVLVTQSCPTLCHPMDYSPSGSSVHEFSRQEYWSGLPFPSARDLPDPGTKPRSSAQQGDSY